MASVIIRGGVGRPVVPVLIALQVALFVDEARDAPSVFLVLLTLHHVTLIHVRQTEVIAQLESSTA